MSSAAEDVRPWGRYRVLATESGWQVKRIEVLPGKRLSLQKHLKRSEKWMVVRGEGLATVGEREIRVSPGVFLDVPCGEIHRMQNTGAGSLVFIEVQFGEYLGEDDIVRLHDDFGRF